jgi:hypothetical protein
MDNKLWELDESESTMDAGSSSSTSSTYTTSDKVVGNQNGRSTSRYPQTWRVVDRGGAVVRSQSSLNSKKLGVVRQNETLVVIGAEGCQLQIVNPDFSWARGWVSASNADGLVILECVSESDQSTQSYRTAQSSESLMDRFFTAFNL